MSGALGFIRANPTTQGFDAMEQRLERTRRRDEAEATDAAIRGGVSDMLGQGARPAPAPAPPPAPAPAAPAPAAPPVVPAARQPSANPATPPAAPAAAPSAAAPMPPAPPPMPAATETASARSGSYRPVLQRLAATPGGGRAALEVMQRDPEFDARQRMQAERNVLFAMGRGDVEVAQFFAQRAGIQIPPELMQNAQVRSRFAAAGLLAQRHYSGSPDQAAIFTQTYVRTGDAAAAAAAAGPPRRGKSAGGGQAPARSTGWQPQWIVQDEKEVLAFFHPETQRMWMPGAPGQQPGATPGATPDAPALGQVNGQPGPAFVTRAPRAGGAGSQPRTPDRVARRDMLIAGGMTEEEANRVAGGAAVTQAQRARAFERFRTAAERDVFETNPERRTAEITRRVNEAMAQWDAIAGQAAGGAPRPAAPAAAGTSAGNATTPARPAQTPATPNPTPQQPAAAARSPAAAATPPGAPGAIPSRPLGVPPGSAFSAKLQQWRDPQGRFYDRDGNPIGGVN